MANAWEILLLKSSTSMLVVSRWIKGCLVWLSQKSLFHVVATIQHWNERDLILMYCIQHNIQVDWIYLFRDHMLKAKRLTDFRLPYVVLVSKFIEYFGIDVEDELEDSIGVLNCNIPGYPSSGPRGCQVTTAQCTPTPHPSPSIHTRWSVDHFLARICSGNLGNLSPSWSYSLQQLKIDFGSILGAFGLIWSLEKVVCGRLGCAITEVWSFLSFVFMPGGFPDLQEGSCCAGVSLVWFKRLLWCFYIFLKV